MERIMLLAVKSAGMAGIYSLRSNLAVPTRTATNIWSDSTPFPPFLVTPYQP